MWTWAREQVHMDAGGFIALGAAVIALFALWFARVSARATEESAAAASRSALASEESVKLAKSAQNRAEKPRFGYALDVAHDDLIKVTVTMLEGPPRIKVVPHYVAKFEFPDHGFSAPLALDAVPTPMVFSQAHVRTRKEASRELIRNEPMILEIGKSDSAISGHVQVTLLCDDIENDDRQWHDIEHMEWAAPRPSRVSKVKFRGGGRREGDPPPP